MPVAFSPHPDIPPTTLPIIPHRMPSNDVAHSRMKA